MTAERAWVRFGARWIARVDSVKSHLSLVFQGMTGVGVASGALEYLGLGHLVGPFIAALAVVLLAYAYLYSEAGCGTRSAVTGRTCRTTSRRRGT